MKVGYARTSTIDQAAGFEAQLAELDAAGCERVFREQVSAVGGRPQLDAALDYLRDGDTLVVTKLDRLARSTMHLGQIIERLGEKAAGLEVLGMGLDSSTATGKLMLNLLGSVAQFEREMMLERQREGIAKAKSEGKYKGRQPTARVKADEVHQLKVEGFGATEIAKRLGIGRASVYRILNDHAG